MGGLYGDWNEYISEFSSEYSRVTDGLQGGRFFILALLLASPLFMILPRKLWILVPLTLILLYSVVLHPPRVVKMSIADGGRTLVVKNLGPTTEWTPLIMEFISKLLQWSSDLRAPGITRTGRYRFGISSRETRVTLPSNDFFRRVPRRQIVLTNHTTKPFVDAFAFCLLLPSPETKLVVVQQHFNSLCDLLVRKLWGGWVIDKDDKTRKGREGLTTELDKLIRVMREERDLTVVIFGTGKTPKTIAQCRNPERIYPGVAYLSLLSGYHVTPLINDIAEDGCFRSVVGEPIDLRNEYRDEIVPYDTVREFKEDTKNRETVEKICNRLRDLSREEYERITKIENGRSGY
jgi:hypothetical protein